jgi:gliding motility-associated protein GldL
MGFNINELVQTRGWKKFMSKVYGWGASAVLIGAMFKIMHWPGAGPMLVLGLSTEAFIFFTSAFEPLHEEYDWSLVYPELAGMHEDVEDTTEHNKPTPKKSALEKFDELLNSAQITPDMFEKLGEGLRDLNTTTEKIADVSNATVATNNYVASFEKASQKVNEFADIYGQSAQSLNATAGTLSGSYQKTTDILNKTTERFASDITEAGKGISDKFEESGKKLAAAFDNAGNNLANTIISAGKESAQTLTGSFNKSADEISAAGAEVAKSYSKISESVNTDFDAITQGSRSYSQQLAFVTKNLTALNAVYELQLQGSNEQMEAAKSLFGGMEEIMQNMKDSVSDVKKYKEEVSKLGQNLAAMNTIYGNMLTAMNFPKQ